MPLIDLKTDLTSLKYGQDRPGGGDSGQPFIVTTPSGGTSVTVGPNNILRILGINSIPSIPNISTQLSRSRIGQIINQVGYDDSLIRGGILGAAQSSLNDFFRIGAYLATVPKGPIFIAKQIGLQLSNPRLEVKKGLRGALSGILNPGGLLGTLTNGALGPTRIYNLGINTLAQVPVNAFGGHLNRHGILPVQSDDTKYEAVVTFNNESNNSQNNRLVGLAKKFELGDRQLEASRLFNLGLARKQNRQSNRAGRQINRASNRKLPPDGLQSLTSFENPFLLPTPPRTKFKRQKLDTTSLTVDSYIGGPGSLYGIGLTVINRYSFTEDKLKIDEAFENASNYSGRSRLDALTPDYAKALSTNNEFQSSGYAISQYGSDIPVSGSDIVSAIDQGAYKVYSSLKNAIDIQKNSAIFTYSSNKNTSLGIGAKDTYNGNINSYINTNTEIVYSNGLKDEKGNNVTVKISGSWANNNREKRVGSGRTDLINLTPIFDDNGGSIGDAVKSITIPGNPDKNINDLVKFRIQAVNGANPSRSEWMIFRAYLTQLSDNTDANWNATKYTGRGEEFYIYGGFSRKIQIGFKVAALSAIEMEPMYQKLNYLMSNLMPDYNNLLMRGPLVKMTVGNWIDGQAGVLNNISYTVPNDSPWEIGLGDKYLILPHIVEVNMTFTPIGSQTQAKNKISAKSLNTSNIAQNYNGANNGEPNYIKP